MPFEKPLRCPLCDGEWDICPSTYNPNVEHFSCINYNKCQLLYIVDVYNFYIIKYLKDETQIWWCSNGPCEIKFGNSFKYEKLNFILPFNINENRLKKFLLFS